jgi:hypothetical protein
MQNVDYSNGFWKKNANFFAENWQKSQKITIITSTPAIICHVTFSFLSYNKTAMHVNM